MLSWGDRVPLGFTHWSCLLVAMLELRAVCAQNPDREHVALYDEASSMGINATVIAHDKLSGAL